MANATIAGVVAIHWKPPPSSKYPVWDAMLMTRKGTNTRNPHAAARPRPTKRLVSVPIENSILALYKIAP